MLAGLVAILTLHISAGTVSHQLQALGTAFDVTMGVADATGADQLRPALDGPFDLDHAMCRILEGSGLTYTFYPGFATAIAIKERPGKTWLEDCTPQDWLNDGPYIDVPKADWR
jgi:hypothetical protein